MSFAGSTVGFQIASPTPTTPRIPLQTAVVGPGVEFPDLAALEVPGDGFLVVDASVDVGPETITLTVNEGIPAAFADTGGGFNGYVFTDEGGTIPPFRGAEIAEGQNSLDLSLGRVFFNEDRLFLRLDGQFYTEGASVTLEVRFGDPAPLRAPEDALFTARLYTAGLDRQPDAEGLNFWIDALPGLGSRDALSQVFLDSPEFSDRFGSVDELGARGFVGLLYANVLDREGDDAGVDFWTDLILSGQLDEAETLSFFVDSAENADSTAGFESFALNAATGDWVFL